jgi:hypothetical protein
MQTIAVMDGYGAKTRVQSRVAAAACWGCHVGEKLLGAFQGNDRPSGLKAIAFLGYSSGKATQSPGNAGAVIAPFTDLDTHPNATKLA